MALVDTHCMSSGKGLPGLLVRLFLLASLLAWAAPASAEGPAYPDKPVRVIVGYSPGGAADIIARLLATKMSANLNQSVIVENRPGASGNIGAQVAAHAPADGYTLLFGTSAEMAVNPYVMKNTGFHADTDFTPIVRAFEVPLALVVSSQSRYKSLADLIEYARAHPGTVDFASTGSGTPGHLAGEVLAARTHTKMAHIPYKGGGAVLVDLMGGRVDFYFAGLNSVAPNIKNGSLRALAISSARRSPLAPDIPTVSELSLPGFDITLWGGLFASRDTPRNVIDTVNRAMNEAYRSPDVKAALNTQLSEVVLNSPAEFSKFVNDERANYAQIVKEIGYRGE
jgi:tripartite-type tricarboxylate transporter receptor subunit TctC